MIWLQTRSGRAFDLLEPTAEMVDFDDIAYSLARIPRFLGHTRGEPYSVAQHCVVGADAIFRETDSRRAAAVFLLHDAHEAYLGDITTPVQQALAAMWKLATLKRGVDAAIHAAAGIGVGSWGPTIKAMDLRLLRAERDALMVPQPMPWGDSIETAAPVDLAEPLHAWPWHVAEARFRAAMAMFLPDRPRR